MQQLRWLLGILLILKVAAAHAQMPQPSPSEAVLQNEIAQLELAKLNFQMQAVTERHRADDLQKQIDELKKRSEPHK